MCVCVFCACDTKDMESTRGKGDKGKRLLHPDGSSAKVLERLPTQGNRRNKKKRGGGVEGGTLAAWNRGAFLISPRFDGNFSN